MKTLALEFSSDHRSAAVWIPAARGSAARSGSACQPTGRATPAFALIEAVLSQAQVPREAIERIVIGLGPGSATGIRTAIAIAQGWQLGRAVELLGLCSLESLAARLHTEGVRGAIHLAVDAQRQEYHVAGYELLAEGVRQTAPLQLAPAAHLEALLGEGGRVYGPGLVQRLPTAHEAYPDALTLARLASKLDACAAMEPLDAIHLRQPMFAKQR